MTAKHTPPPWTVQYLSGSSDDKREAHFALIAPRGRSKYADLSSFEENTANAHLFEAAPLLLSSLTAVLPLLERAATEEARANRAPTGSKPRRERLDEFDAARRAIAAAKGEKP